MPLFERLGPTTKHTVSSHANDNIILAFLIVTLLDLICKVWLSLYIVYTYGCMLFYPYDTLKHNSIELFVSFPYTLALLGLYKYHHTMT